MLVAMSDTLAAIMGNSAVAGLAAFVIVSDAAGIGTLRCPMLVAAICLCVAAHAHR